MAAGIHTGFGDEWVRIGAVKQYADGSISERTAWLSQPYIGIPNNYVGITAYSREELYERGRKAHAAGWQLATHANGDLAIDRILGVYEQIQKENPRKDPRFRIEHCTLINDSLDPAHEGAERDSRTILLLRVLPWRRDAFLR